MIKRGTTLGTGPLVTLYITTKEWTMGNYVFFEARLKSGTTIEVDWGDGQTSMLAPLDTCLSRVDHFYKERGSEMDYIINFYSEDRNSLLELYNGVCEVHVEAAYFIHCYSLTKLRIPYVEGSIFGHVLGSLNIWACGSLEELNIDYFNGEMLNTTFGMSMPRLKKLQCNGSDYLEEIDLRGCNEVETLVCRSCHRLKKIILNNSSKLRSVDFDGTALYKDSMKFISKIIEKNTTNE